MKVMNVNGDLFPFASQVDSGVAELVRKQEAGWSISISGLGQNRGRPKAYPTFSRMSAFQLPASGRAWRGRRGRGLATGRCGARTTSDSVIGTAAASVFTMGSPASDVRLPR